MLRLLVPLVSFPYLVKHVTVMMNGAHAFFFYTELYTIETKEIRYL
jgi:hypothetical protein